MRRGYRETNWTHVRTDRWMKSRSCLDRRRRCSRSGGRRQPPTARRGDGGFRQSGLGGSLDQGDRASWREKVDKKTNGNGGGPAALSATATESHLDPNRRAVDCQSCNFFLLFFLFWWWAGRGTRSIRRQGVHHETGDQGEAASRTWKHITKPFSATVKTQKWCLAAASWLLSLLFSKNWSKTIRRDNQHDPALKQYFQKLKINLKRWDCGSAYQIHTSYIRNWNTIYSLCLEQIKGSYLLDLDRWRHYK